MRVKNLEELKVQIRPFLREYLEENDTKFRDKHFSCPNRIAHKSDDSTPSASFFPDTDHWKCFVCDDAKGDIFTAAYYLEGKPLTGPEFITDNILYLAN